MCVFVVAAAVAMTAPLTDCQLVAGELQQRMLIITDDDDEDGDDDDGHVALCA